MGLYEEWTKTWVRLSAPGEPRASGARMNIPTMPPQRAPPTPPNVVAMTASFSLLRLGFVSPLPANRVAICLFAFHFLFPLLLFIYHVNSTGLWDMLGLPGPFTYFGFKSVTKQLANSTAVRWKIPMFFFLILTHYQHLKAWPRKKWNEWKKNMNKISFTEFLKLFIRQGGRREWVGGGDR